MRLGWLFGIPLLLFARGAVVPDDYRIREGNATRYIYPSGAHLDVERIAKEHARILERYTDEFGYRLDQPLYVGFAGSNEQIANAFSTQLPLNEAIFYGAGALHYDRFASRSWYKMLLMHESAHNFQLNPKTGPLAKLAHAVGGNMPLIAPLFVPMFPIPNITIDRFTLEGNAVMNESRFGNGGRLYSGYALSQTVALAHAGRLRPEEMVNVSLRFPYGEKFYLAGGFFQQFLAQRYGVARVNGYFKRYAAQTIPLFGNRVFREHYGKDFVTLLGEFARQMRTRHRGYIRTQGDVLARSQLDAPLTKHNGEILALTGDRRSKPRMITYTVDSGRTRSQTGAWYAGRPLRIGGRLYTLASATVAPAKIRVGLFDRNGYLKQTTAGKAVQGFLDDGRMVYIDIARSWDAPIVRVGNRRYGRVHSSVLVRGKHLYYFRQEGSRRVLYRDRTPLIRFEGYDARPVDVDAHGRVYFVAPSPHGSTVYRTANGRIERVVRGDDVIDLKLISPDRAIVRTVGAEGYAIVRTRLHPVRSRVPFRRLGFATIEQDHGSVRAPEKLAAPKPYSPIAQLKYAGLLSRSSWSKRDGYGLDLQAQLSDPLWLNALTFSMRYRRERTLLSVAYRNRAHMLEYGGSLTRVLKHTGAGNGAYRDWGYSAYVKWPFLARGYWRGSMSLTYTKPYDDTHRKPLTLGIDIAHRQQFGYSKYPNTLYALGAFLARDRDTTMWGGSFRWMHDVTGQSFVSLKGTYLHASDSDARTAKGIRVGQAATRNGDPAALPIATFDRTLYARNAAMIEAGVYTVFEHGWYGYTFPMSLLRYTLFFKHRIYALDTGEEPLRRYRESVAGIEADVLFQRRYPVPVRLEVFYSKDAHPNVQVRMSARYRF
jgi:hypothetical protein